MKKIYKEVDILVNNEETRNAAFLKFNRTINFDNVKKLEGFMEAKGYRMAESIQVLKAEDVIANGDIAILDINGEKIKEGDECKYYVVLDGQHRVYAASLFNEEIAKNNGDTIQVPAIIVELKENETIAEYLNEINITKKQWTTADYIQGACNVKPDNKFLCCINSKLKREDNPLGYPLSTLCLIYCGRKDAIKTSDFSLLCAGKDVKGKEGKNIIPTYNLENGDKFIKICKEKRFDEQTIAKRYLIEQFNGFVQEYGNVKIALEIFDSISDNDIEAMLNERGKVDGALVITQFIVIKKRYDDQRK